MAATSRSTVASPAASRATRRPSRSTSIRSAISSTCVMLWLISTTAMPWSRTCLIRSSTRPVCTTPRAAVGSSMKITLVRPQSRRARWRPTGADRPTATRRARRATEADTQATRIVRAPAAASLAVERTRVGRADPDRTISRPRNRFSRRQLRRQGEVLVDRRDAEPAGVRRGIEGDRLRRSAESAPRRAGRRRTGSSPGSTCRRRCRRSARRSPPGTPSKSAPSSACTCPNLRREIAGLQQRRRSWPGLHPQDPCCWRTRSIHRA